MYGTHRCGKLGVSIQFVDEDEEILFKMEMSCRV
jgi:hypothetical protein